MPTTWWNLTLELERAIQKKLVDYTHDLWKEDTITIDIVKAARSVLNNTKIDADSEKAKVIAEVFKADGKLEETFGDLAVVVEVSYRDGQKLKGAAFFEAKKRDWDTNNISAAKRKQLQAMHKVLWNGKLLVYDPEPQASRLTEITFTPWWWEHASSRSGPNLAPVTQALSMPLGPVLQCETFTTATLYKFGTPFSCQLVLRNLQGLDLDHDDEAVKAAAGYSTKMGVPKLVLAVAVRLGPGEVELPAVNADVLTRAD